MFRQVRRVIDETRSYAVRYRVSLTHCVYHGNAKPSSVSEYLKDFITESKKLIEEGFQYVGKHYKVVINAVICDTPARSYVKCVKSHNAHFGCGLCIQEGEYLHNRVLFTDMDSFKRTDDNFRRRTYEEHHVGVMKKLLVLWLRGRRDCRLTAMKIEQLSDFLVTLSTWIPEEFQRKCRSLKEFEHWKATEFRLFLLYIGPAALRTILPLDHYIHFNAFNCAMRILCHLVDCFRNNQYAQDLLKYFVRECKTLYGEENLIYNVHNLIHLSNDVLTYGSLDTFSAFSFENYMQKLKKMIRKSQSPLQQIHRRISEYKENMYVVLFFENSCATVPASWVREKERMCWWPPKTINLSKAIAKCTPHEDHWIMNPFHKLWGPYAFTPE
ncbi:uncharacterized protein [Temnothorax nylanderi]|uniref:uncharacterized protein n=1 Tax=Temnothorax nylanderi TaxID=102681 RepID=UPI003A8A672F